MVFEWERGSSSTNRRVVAAVGASIIIITCICDTRTYVLTMQVGMMYKYARYIFIAFPS